MNSILLIGMPGAPEWVIIVLALLLPAFALLDILKNQFKGAYDKLIWFFVVLFLPLFGSLLYFAIGRSQRVTS